MGILAHADFSHILHKQTCVTNHLPEFLLWKDLPGTQSENQQILKLHHFCSSPKNSLVPVTNEGVRVRCRTGGDQHRQHKDGGQRRAV